MKEIDNDDNGSEAHHS